jgi:hypothetical protein
MNEQDYVIDLLRGATTSNLLDHYDLAKSNVTKCKNNIKRLQKNKNIFDRSSKVNQSIRFYQQELTLAKKNKDAIFGLLLSVYNKHCQINQIPFGASNITDIKKANVDIKIVVVKRKAAL